MVNSNSGRPFLGLTLNWAAFAASFLVAVLAYYWDGKEWIDTPPIARAHSIEMLGIIGAWLVLVSISITRLRGWAWLALLPGPVMALFALRSINTAIWGWTNLP